MVVLVVNGKPKRQNGNRSSLPGVHAGKLEPELQVQAQHGSSQKSVALTQRAQGMFLHSTILGSLGI